jgi:hypothetical protein
VTFTENCWQTQTRWIANRGIYRFNLGFLGAVAVFSAGIVTGATLDLLPRLLPGTLAMDPMTMGLIADGNAETTNRLT